MSKKIQNHIKSVKSKEFDRLCCVISHVEFDLVLSY